MSTAQDISNFSSPEAHRIISLPASQSLRATIASASAAASAGSGAIPTGLNRLDEALSSRSSAPQGTQGATSTQSPQHRPKGIPRGHVTEVFGPPGVGKTSLAMRVAANTLQDGGKVVWIDTGSPIPIQRLRKMLLRSMKTTTMTTTTTTTKPAADTDPSSSPPAEGKTSTSTSSDPDSLIDRLLYFRTPSLPHLLALLLHPPKDFPPPGTTLLVVDSISAPFQSYFPNATEFKARLLAQGKDTQQQQGHVQWLLNRKWNVVGDMAGRLARLAASGSDRTAVLLLNQTHTKIRGQPRATLSPALAGGAWEAAVHARVVLYRDWLLPSAAEAEMEMDAFTVRNVRFAEVMKRGGRGLAVRTGENIVPFLIEGDSLREISNTRPPSAPLEPEPVPTSTPTPTPTPASAPAPSTIPVPVPVSEKRRKRKVDEIADSEDEDEDEDEDADEGALDLDCLDDGWIEDEEEKAKERYWAMEEEELTTVYDPITEADLY